jgi:tetratricopeptide (TPR) repeat protein
MPAIRKWLWVATALLIVGANSVARAEEPYLEMIRGLRAQGEPELALEYIQEKLVGKVPSSLAQVISLELARTRVEIARNENEEGRRLALFAAARAEFENFLKANPNDPLAPQARFEIARLMAAQGKEALNRARRAQGDARIKAMTDARPAFETAATQLTAAAKQLKAQGEALGEPTKPEEKATAREAIQSWLKAQLEQGMNLYLMAQTYAATERPAELKEHARLLTDAGAVFEKLMNVDSKQPICWLARAWLARCFFENDDYPKAVLQFDAIQGEKGPHADEAKRVANYFRILMFRRQGTVSAAQLLTQLQNWLERYHAYINTPEGCGARYMMADVLESQAYSMPGGIKLNDKGRPVSVSLDAAAKLKQAERQLRSLTEFENDFSDRAAAKRMRIILAIAIRETPDRDPAKLKTFESCYLLALLEVAELNEAIKDPKVAENPDEVARIRKTQYARAVVALERALSLEKPTDPAKELTDARIMLVYSYVTIGNNRKAAEMGEQIAKTLTRSSRGAVPALFALQAYKNLLAEAIANGDTKDAIVRNAREQVRRLATFMEATWPNDSPTDTARHTLGALYFNDGDYVKALETFARVTPSYSSLAYLRNDQGVACFDLQKDPKVAKAVKDRWFNTITSELERMPDLAQGAEPETAYNYCMAKMQLGNLLLQAGKDFPKVEQIGKTILDQSSKYDLGDKAAEVKYTAKAQMLYGLYGRVSELMKAQRHTEAAALYQPVIADLEKNGIPEDEAAAKARKAISDLLQLCLRSSVQDGQIDRAQGMLKLLEKASSGLKDVAPGGGPLVSVLREVQAQINEMRKNDPSRLKDTIDKFASFLDTLAKQPNLSIEVKIFLAQGFASLDDPNRGVNLLATIKPPPSGKMGGPPAPPPESAPEADRAKYEDARTKYEAAKQSREQEWKVFWFAQLTHERELRQLGRLETDKAAKDKAFQAAERMIDEMIGTPQKQGWAFNSLEVRRERAFLLEDQGKFADAMKQWSTNERPFQAQMQNRAMELKTLGRAVPDTIEKDVDALAARLNQSDKEILSGAEVRRAEQRAVKLRYDLGLKELEKLGLPPIVHQIVQKRLLVAKLRNQPVLEQELTAARAGPEGKWLEEHLVGKKLHFEEGMREIARKIRESRGLKEDAHLDPSADQAVLETMWLLTVLQNKPKLDAEFQQYREVVYRYHFYKIRCVYLSKARNPILLKDEKRKEAEYRKVVANIVKMEKDPETADFGGNEVKKLYRELLDDDEMLKKAYVLEGGTSLLN